MTEIENALLDALERFESSWKDSEKNIARCLHNLLERVKTLENESLQLKEQIAQLSCMQNEMLKNWNEQLEQNRSFQQQQEIILKNLSDLLKD